MYSKVGFLVLGKSASCGVYGDLFRVNPMFVVMCSHGDCGPIDTSTRGADSRDDGDATGGTELQENVVGGRSHGADAVRTTWWH